MKINTVLIMITQWKAGSVEKITNVRQSLGSVVNNNVEAIKEQ
jgi:hypothetical protein